ncbi:MAG TPA: DedA family protein [Lichenihabitans sp.]|jgi:membrane protein DedA with SNARE-associated domain|nr:DedA family protein [Lichenihabitans sp.]
MVSGLIALVASWIVGVISAIGYAGVAGLMAIESACLPLPSEIIMPFAGYLASTGRFTLVLAATAGAIGCNIGSTVAYEIGARGGRRLVERWGRYIFLSPGDLDRADRFFLRFGGPAVLIGRLLPVIRTFIALPAGIARMPRLRFQVYTFLGSWPWCYALAYVGYQLGTHWDSDPRLRAIFHSLDAVIVGAVVLGVIWLAWRHRRSQRTDQ